MTCTRDLHAGTVPVMLTHIVAKTLTHKGVVYHLTADN
jgi:hypothetical protein